ncbi:MAG: 50S ribosomal protein L17 [bacterium]
MRHSRGNKKIGRPTDQRLALLSNQVTKLFLHGKLTTTEEKARATKRVAEKTLTTAIANDLSAKKSVRRIVNDKDAFKKIFEEYVPRYASRKGGYLSMVKLPPRRGDGADMAILSFVEVE